MTGKAVAETRPCGDERPGRLSGTVLAAVLARDNGCRRSLKALPGARSRLSGVARFYVRLKKRSMREDGCAGQVATKRAVLVVRRISVPAPIEISAPQPGSDRSQDVGVQAGPFSHHPSGVGKSKGYMRRHASPHSIGPTGSNLTGAAPGSTSGRDAAVIHLPLPLRHSGFIEGDNELAPVIGSTACDSGPGAAFRAHAHGGPHGVRATFEDRFGGLAVGEPRHQDK
jgi:hypothetical protein